MKNLRLAFKYAFKDLTQQKIRAGLGAIGVMISVGLLAIILFLADSISISYVNFLSNAAAGQDMVIKSLPQIIKNVPNLKYVIAGNGEYLKKLQNLTEEYQLNNHVIFAGYVPCDQLLNYYDLCDVFVMPSRQEGENLEGLGLTFLEASARGKPVVGGNHGGVPEAVVHGETGLLVDPHSTDDIANAIIKLLSDNKLAQKIGRQGKERVFSEFSWKNTAQKILEKIK